MQECGGSSLKTTKNDNHGYQIGLGKFRIIAKKKSLCLCASFFHLFTNVGKPIEKSQHLFNVWTFKIGKM